MNKRWPYKKSKYGKKKHEKRETPKLGLEPVQFFREEDDKMKKFWELVKDSVIVQGIVTLAFVGTACYLFIEGRELPEALIYFVSGVLGYFFGAKQQQITGGK